jgi:hypothetical protein
MLDAFCQTNSVKNVFAADASCFVNNLDKSLPDLKLSGLRTSFTAMAEASL